MKNQNRPVKLATLGEAQVVGKKGMLSLILVRTPRTLKWFRCYPEKEGEEGRDCWLLQKEQRSSSIHLVRRISAMLCEEHGFEML